MKILLLLSISLALLIGCSQKQPHDYTHASQKEFAPALEGKWKLSTTGETLMFVMNVRKNSSDSNLVIGDTGEMSYFSIVRSFPIAGDTLPYWLLIFPNNKGGVGRSIVRKLTTDTLQLGYHGDMLVGMFVRQ